MGTEDLRARLYDVPRLLTLGAALRRARDAGGASAEVVFRPQAARVERLGLLPGSFNPPTVAHAALAAAGLASGAVESVLFTLSTHTVDKEAVSGASLEDRLLLLELCCEGDARLGVLLVNRGLYVAQAELVRRTLPHVRDLVFLIGFDKIVQILDPRYYDDRDAALERLFSLATFRVAPRGAAGRVELDSLLARPENAPFVDAIRPLDLPRPLREIASSRVRAAVPSGRLPSEALPVAARIFVAETGAYDAGGRAERYRRRLGLLAACESSPGHAVDLRALVGPPDAESPRSRKISVPPTAPSAAARPYNASEEA